MKEGRVTKRPINWRRYFAPALDLDKNVTKTSNDSWVSCGSCALSTITGISVKNVEKYIKNPENGWYTTTMIRYLRSKGYTVVEISKNKILGSDYFSERLGRSHCLLINAHTDYNENSAYVCHAGDIWHNFYKIHDPLFFLNKPPQDVLLIWHKKWSLPGVNWSNFRFA